MPFLKKKASPKWSLETNIDWGWMDVIQTYCDNKGSVELLSYSITNTHIVNRLFASGWSLLEEDEGEKKKKRGKFLNWSLFYKKILKLKTKMKH